MKTKRERNKKGQFTNGELVDFTCAHCNSIKKVVPNVVKRRQYCSNECRIMARRRLVINQCKTCSKEIHTTPANNQRYCDKKCAGKNRMATFGREKNHNWKGKKAGLTAIHKWIQNHYGKANKCEMENCTGESSTYHWSKLKDKEYEQKRENYWMLCVKCHSKYDRGDMTKEYKLENYGPEKKPVKQYDLNGTYLKTFPSTGYAAYELGADYNGQCKIYRAAVGRKKDRIALGFKWKYEKH